MPTPARLWVPAVVFCSRGSRIAMKTLQDKQPELQKWKDFLTTSWSCNCLTVPTHSAYTAFSWLSRVANFPDCNTNGVLEAPAMWLLQLIIENPSEATCNVHRCLSSQNQAAQKHKRTSGCQAINYLLASQATDYITLETSKNIMNFNQPAS